MHIGLVDFRLLGAASAPAHDVVGPVHVARGNVKVTVGLAKGKRQYEKRADESKKQWERDRERLMKKATR